MAAAPFVCIIELQMPGMDAQKAMVFLLSADSLIHDSTMCTAVSLCVASHREYWAGPYDDLVWRTGQGSHLTHTSSAEGFMHIGVSHTIESLADSVPCTQP